MDYREGGGRDMKRETCPCPGMSMDVFSTPGPQCQPITFPARPEFQGSPATTEEMQGIAAAQDLVEYKQLQKDNVHNSHQLPWERHRWHLSACSKNLGTTS